MKFQKIHFTLIFFAILPFLSFIQIGDYCFGVADLLIIGGLTIVFFISFLVISFYDLYNLSIRKLRFNFLPLTILAIFSILLFVNIKFQGKYMFKNQLYAFKSILNEGNSSKIILFTNNTFELKIVSREETCTQKGIYQIKKDTLFLNKTNNSYNNAIFDSIYYFNREKKLLIPNKMFFSKLKLLQ